jgi:hypothetical protein
VVVGGRLHLVLQGWILPSTHIKDMWNLWQSVASLSRLLGCAILKKLDLHNNTAHITLRLILVLRSLDCHVYGPAVSEIDADNKTIDGYVNPDVVNTVVKALANHPSAGERMKRKRVWLATAWKNNETADTSGCERGCVKGRGGI